MTASKRIPSLDGLRAISIAFVLLAHLSGTRGFPFHVPENLGNLGVRIFFVISGYLITRLLLEESSRTGTISLPKFYLRRAFRIFPAGYTYILTMIALSWAGAIALNRWDTLCALTYTINHYYDRSWYVGHLWSLSVEEQFYLLWPAVLLFTGKRRALAIAIGVFLGAPLVRMGILLFLPRHWPGIGTVFPTIADAIAIGCILACVRDRLGVHPKYVAFIGSKWFALVPLAVFALNYSFSTKVSFLVEQSLLNAAIALCVDRCVRVYDGPVGKVLNSAPFVSAGVLSYSLYLWQQPFLNRDSDYFLQRFPLNITLAIAMAAVSYWLVEKPFLQLKTRFESYQRSRSERVPV